LLGQLASSSRFQVATHATAIERAFTYDAAGNLDTQTHPLSGTNAGNVSLSYQDADTDRNCSSIGYAGATPPSVCNVTYDDVGNVTRMPSRASGTRTFTYFPNGLTKFIVQGSTNASSKYDAFGAVQQLRLTSTTSADPTARC